MKIALALRFLAPFLAAAFCNAQTGANSGNSVFTLPSEGCPQAHCTAHLSDSVGSISPEIGDVVALDGMTQGSNHGLGCSSNTHVVACTFSATSPPDLVVYDGEGRRLFADNAGLLDSTAFASAPMVFADDKVLAVDISRLILYNADGSLRWLSNKPDAGTPTSPVLVGDSIILLATLGGAISTWDLNTGQVLSSLKLSDPPQCGSYDTGNTPTVNGNRAYILANCTTDNSQGALAAVDVVTDPGPARGTMRPAWLYKFTGPSGASPLYHNGVLFFDGVLASDPTKGVFMGVQDAGTKPVLQWRRTFTSTFAANAAADPRGGFWVFPVGVSNVYRLRATDGSILEVLPVPTPAGTTGPYEASSAMSVSQTLAGDVVLTFGIVSVTITDPAAVMAYNVTQKQTLWQTFIDPNMTGNSTAAQFPIVKNSSGIPRVVFPGSVSGTFFLGKTP